MKTRLSATVQRRLDVLAAASEARASALSFGIAAKQADELALVVAELGMNALNHGQGQGTVEVSVDSSGWVVGVDDSGPGLSAAVLADAGRSDHFGANGARPLGDGGSFGSGLASVRRLSTSLELANKASGGARAVASRTLSSPTNDRIERVVDLMAKAACKEYQHRLQIADDAVDDPFLQVEVGLNVVLEDLQEAEVARQKYVKEIERKNEEIADRAAMALRELSTPIIAVWDGELTLPIIGMVDTARGAEMMDQLLTRVAADQARYVIIDITGVSVVDTRTADSFIRMSEAVRLVGAECFLTGISPAIAQTIAQLGIDTSRIRTLRRLSDALKVVFANLGVQQSRAESHPFSSGGAHR